MCEYWFGIGRCPLKAFSFYRLYSDMNAVIGFVNGVVYHHSKAACNLSQNSNFHILAKIKDLVVSKIWLRNLSCRRDYQSDHCP